MKNIYRILVLIIMAAAAQVKAIPGAAMLEARYQEALNAIVQNVRNEPEPAAKREIMNRYLDHMQDGLRQAQSLATVAEPDKQALQAVSGKLAAYDAELDGKSGYAPVADADLDGFAAYMQQGMEQAPIGGGVYLSGGVIIIILLILLILT